MIYTNAINGVPFNSEAYLHLKNLLATSKAYNCYIYYPTDDVYPTSPDEYGLTVNGPYHSYGRELIWLERSIGKANEGNVPGAGMAIALAGCIGEVVTPAEKFPYLSSLSTLRDIANCDEAKAEILNNKKTFRLICMSEYLRTYLNIPITKNDITTDSTYHATLSVTTTVEKPYIYIHLDGFEPRGGRYSKVNLISNGVTRNVWTSTIRSGAGRDDNSLPMQVHLVVDPVVDYNLGRTVTVEYSDVGTASNYHCPIYVAS